jgi:glutathione peroxidase-family protein
MLSGRKGKIYSIKVKNAEGKDVKMKQYKGKVLLIVNTATRCGFTPQYKELESMYEKYHAQGLEVLDFPCNQFGEQAPGTIAEIRQFCTSNYNTQFEQFAKIDVNGDDASPLFTYLKAQKGFGGFDTSDQRGKFMDDMMPKLLQVRRLIDERNPACELEVDGGINPETARLCAQHGANVFVAGSNIFKAPDRALRIEEIRSCMK